jgi:hypothetical protein
MNKYLQEKWPWIEGSHSARTTLLESLSDTDLAFSPGGQALTLGALCREFGETEYSYIESLKTLKQDWAYHNHEAGLETSVGQLQAWYQSLDKSMKDIVSAFSDDDLKQIVERGFPVPVEIQLDIYLQALLIFFGKISIYLRVMNKPLTEQFLSFIG